MLDSDHFRRTPCSREERGTWQSRRNRVRARRPRVTGDTVLGALGNRHEGKLAGRPSSEVLRWLPQLAVDKRRGTDTLPKTGQKSAAAVICLPYWLWKLLQERQPPVALLHAVTLWWLTLLVPVNATVPIFSFLCGFCCLLLLPHGSIFVSLPFVRLLEELTAGLLLPWILKPSWKAAPVFIFHNHHQEEESETIGSTNPLCATAWSQATSRSGLSLVQFTQL